MDRIEISFVTIRRSKQDELRKAGSKLDSLLSREGKPEEGLTFERYERASGSGPQETVVSLNCLVHDPDERWPDIKDFLADEGLLEEAKVELFGEESDSPVQLYP